jgi:hypothetical protein
MLIGWSEFGYAIDERNSRLADDIAAARRPRRRRRLQTTLKDRPHERALAKFLRDDEGRTGSDAVDLGGTA